MIAALVEQDLPFCEPAIAEPVVAALNGFAHRMGLLTATVPYEQVVATRFRPLWQWEPWSNTFYQAMADVSLDRLRPCLDARRGDTLSAAASTEDGTEIMPVIIDAAHHRA